MQNVEKIIQALKNWETDINNLGYGTVTITMRAHKLAKMEISKSFVFNDVSDEERQPVSNESSYKSKTFDNHRPVNRP